MGEFEQFTVRILRGHLLMAPAALGSFPVCSEHYRARSFSAVAELSSQTLNPRRACQFAVGLSTFSVQVELSVMFLRNCGVR